jgi:molybdopterin-guanine dinucleotide biosynthesis protein A
VIDFVAQLNTRYVTAEELRTVDLNLLSLRNCNTMAEYEELLG